jgi:hypothetical protein
MYLLFAIPFAMIIAVGIMFMSNDSEGNVSDARIAHNTMPQQIEDASIEAIVEYFPEKGQLNASLRRREI